MTQEQLARIIYNYFVEGDNDYKLNRPTIWYHEDAELKVGVDDGLDCKDLAKYIELELAK